MARYIDADALIKQMKDVDRERSFQRGVNLATDYWITEINHFPAADVVPKSEVEKLNNKLMIWKQDRFNLYQRLELYKMAREKVAREIFEEIDKVLNFYKKYNPYNDLLKCVIDRIAELKKKYTENKGE